MIRSAFVLASAADLSLSLTQPNAGISWSLVFCQFYLQQPLCLQLTALFSTWKTAVCNSSLGFSHCAERQLCLRRSAKIFNCRFRATAPLLSVRGRRTFVQLSSCQFVLVSGVLFSFIFPPSPTFLQNHASISHNAFFTHSLVDISLHH